MMLSGRGEDEREAKTEPMVRMRLRVRKGVLADKVLGGDDTFRKDMLWPGNCESNAYRRGCIVGGTEVCVGGEIYNQVAMKK